MAVGRSAPIDRMLRPVHRWVWGDVDRRVRKLLAFAEVETDGGRDIVRAAEVTPDPLLRRLYLAHAIDELHTEICSASAAPHCFAHGPARSRRCSAGSSLPGGHGLDDLRIDGRTRPSLLAFLHVAKKPPPAASQSTGKSSTTIRTTRAVFEEILRDEVFHMNYTYTQLARMSPGSYRRRVWRARASRLWKQYLRVAAAVAGSSSARSSSPSCISSCSRRSPGLPNAPSGVSRLAGADRRDRNESLTGQY